MIRLVQGERVVVSAVLTKNGSPLDITNWDIKAATRRTIDGAVLTQPAVTKTAPGTFTVTFDQTSSLPIGQVVLAIRIASQDNTFIRTFNEQVTVIEDSNW